MFSGCWWDETLQPTPPRLVDLHLTDKNLKNYEYTPKVEESDRISIRYNKRDRSYFVFVPQRKILSMPILVALHGAGRSGASMIDTWRRNAEENSIIVIAPNGLNSNWDIGVDEKGFIEAIINETISNSKIEPGNIYLFGHSSGAKKAIAMAYRHPAMYDGVVAHAGTLPSGISKFSEPSLPKNLSVGLFLGDSDHIFSVESGNQTIRWLSSEGLDADLFILKDHSHWYYSDAYKINKRVWKYLQEKI